MGGGEGRATRWRVVLRTPSRLAEHDASHQVHDTHDSHVNLIPGQALPAKCTMEVHVRRPTLYDRRPRPSHGRHRRLLDCESPSGHNETLLSYLHFLKKGCHIMAVTGMGVRTVFMLIIPLLLGGIPLGVPPLPEDPRLAQIVPKSACTTPPGRGWPNRTPRAPIVRNSC